MCVCDVQDLQLALEKARSALQEREEQLREGEQERQREDEERERTIGELRTSLLTKEQLIEVRDVRTVRSEQLLSCFVTDIDRVRLGVLSQERTLQTLHMLHIQKPAELPPTNTRCSKKKRCSSC